MTPSDEARADALIKYIEFLRRQYYEPRARNAELKAYLDGHTKAPHWYDADRSGFSDEVPW